VRRWREKEGRRGRRGRGRGRGRGKGRGRSKKEGGKEGNWEGEGEGEGKGHLQHSHLVGQAYVGGQRSSNFIIVHDEDREGGHPPKLDGITPDNSVLYARLGKKLKKVRTKKKK
jgi:hypothetical protein